MRTKKFLKRRSKVEYQDEIEIRASAAQHQSIVPSDANLLGSYDPCLWCRMTPIHIKKRKEGT